MCPPHLCHSIYFNQWLKSTNKLKKIFWSAIKSDCAFHLYFCCFISFLLTCFFFVFCASLKPWTVFKSTSSVNNIRKINSFLLCILTGHQGTSERLKTRNSLFLLFSIYRFVCHRKYTWNYNQKIKIFLKWILYIGNTILLTI